MTTETRLLFFTLSHNKNQSNKAITELQRIKGKTEFCPPSPRNKSTKIRRINFQYSLKVSFLFSGEQITDSVTSKKQFYCSRSGRETVAAPPRQI